MAGRLHRAEYLVRVCLGRYDLETRDKHSVSMSWQGPRSKRVPVYDPRQFRESDKFANPVRMSEKTLQTLTLPRCMFSP